MGLYLTRDGHRVLSASDGLDGLRQARASKPDLIVLDLMLPGMGGMEICRELRDESAVPIVMLTAREALERGPEQISHGDVTLDLRRRSVSMAGKAAQLTPTEFRLLSMFMREPGRTFTRDQIIDRVFGYDFDGYDRTVDAHVANLRRRLGANARHVHTVYGVGYRFGDA